MPTSLFPLLLAVTGLVALGCLIGAFWALNKKRLIDDLPTSKTQGVFIGLVELKGTAETESPLTAFLSGTRCVQNAWHVEEQWRRMVTETYTDSKGHAQVRTRVESGWTRIADGRQSIPFYLKDDTGVIRIVPDGAKVESVETFNETCSPDDALYFGKGPRQQIANSTHRRRFHETAIPLHAQLYVMGQARERQDIVAAEIAQDKRAPIFLISVRTEKQISRSFGVWLWMWLALGLAVAVGAGAVWDQSGRLYTGANAGPYLVGALGFLAALALGWVWIVYNGLIGLHHRVEQGWSQVEVQLKRRHDLIPNLVATVEGYRAHETETQKLLAELRTQAEATPPGVTGPDFKGIAPMLRAVVERYPELKAGESFLSLQESLVDTEQRIALARDYFNNIATSYNTRLGIVPDRFVAGLARLRPQALMGAADFERAPVEVRLAE